MRLSTAVDLSAGAARSVGTRSGGVQVAAVKTPVTTIMIRDLVMDVTLWTIIILDTYS